ncbi:MAG: D-glycerate dehydrogenase [Candidatus Stahlbacteria bacterium]|nr:D-glycerate dehydrogenase [Candidatus Stahlbacteria bacterium]
MKIYVTRELPGAEFERLKEEYSVVVNPSSLPPTEDELLAAVRDKDGVITLLTDRMTKKIIDGSTLKVIANCAAGYDNIDITHCTERGIMVTNTPDVLTNATAELTFALILSVARMIVQADRYTRGGNFNAWSPTLFVGMELHDSVLGIIGAGKIGTEVGIRAKAFGMHILYTDLLANPRLNALGARRVGLNELLGLADIITLHIPLTSSTHRLIGAAEFNLMKPTCFVINVARGKVIDEHALVVALKTTKIAGAGLDVYENEPIVSDELKELDNVVMLPHIGSATLTARIRMANLAIKNLCTGLEGGKPPNLVNPIGNTAVSIGNNAVGSENTAVGSESTAVGSESTAVGDESKGVR